MAILLFTIGWLMGFGVGDFCHYLGDKWWPPAQLSSSQINFSLNSENSVQLEDYIVRFPKSLQTPWAMLMLNEHYLKRGEFFKSAALLKISRRELQGSIRYQFFAIRWAKQLAKYGQYRQSQEILDKIDIWARPEKLRGLGELAWSQGKNKAAADYWRELYFRYPDTASSAEIVGCLAVLEYNAKKLLSPRLKIAGAMYLCEKKKYQEALNILGDSENDALTYQQIKVLNQAGEFERAIACATLFSEKYPQSNWLEPVLVNRAYNIGVRSKHYREAIECYRDLLKKFPKTSRRAAIELSIGDCLVGLGQFAQAHDQYLYAANCTNSENLSQAAFYSIANIHLRQGQIRQALPWLEKANSQHGELNDKVLWSMANAWKNLGELEKMREICRELLAKTHSSSMRRKVERCLKEIE